MELPDVTSKGGRSEILYMLAQYQNDFLALQEVKLCGSELLGDRLEGKCNWIDEGYLL